jgi:hypothetical protein
MQNCEVMSDNSAYGNSAFKEGDFVDKVELGKGFLEVLLFPYVRTIPPVLHTHISVIDCRRYITLVSTSFIK